MRKGISIAGTIVIDKYNYINEFPNEGNLTTIYKKSKNFGGCVPNTAINLSLINRNEFISVLGNIGDDEDGRDLIRLFENHHIDTSQITTSVNNLTSTVDCYINSTNDYRTFFADLKTNNEFGRKEIRCNTTHFHIGYILLMPYLDEIVDENDTRLSLLLKKMNKQGIKVSADLVSKETNDFKKIVIPSLKYIDYLIINEIEAQNITDIKVIDNEGNLDLNSLKTTAKKIKSLGVKELVVIHSPQLGLIYDGERFEVVFSLELPENYIVSSVGAGDGFCAGILYGILNNLSYNESLRLASCVAASVLASENSFAVVNGVDNFFELEKKYPRKNKGK